MSHIDWLIHFLPLQSALHIPTTRKFLILVKSKRRTPEAQLNPCLIYVESLEQVHVELMDEDAEARGSAGGSYIFCTRASVTLHRDMKNDQKMWSISATSSQKCEIKI